MDSQDHFSEILLWTNLTMDETMVTLLGFSVIELLSFMVGPFFHVRAVKKMIFVLRDSRFSCCCLNEEKHKQL